MDQAEQITIEFLRKFEIPPSLSGYGYIKTAVNLLLEKPSRIHSVIKELYPAIADLHDTEWTRVERGIRIAIQDTKYNNQDAIRSSLYISTNRIQNGHFLAALAEAVRLEIARKGS